ncbi:hypothetical protein FXO38_17337 [Capsicum annuum]|uniref:Integrase catalytic domain-containing protein n=1 Tax=Capsicum annuum TaxID=4072 RepID=A0A2G2ZTB3_CAPAN|nr:hypothetical protein FXO38_17337 [Capsicum annuum]KAF3658258.1 hypothetical protein FXO37_14488 [Capsicum annuum]PHT85216.1 hypothetical protein T459_07322 [Capsicum annuum]
MSGASPSLQLLDDKPWFFDIKQYIQSGEYPTHATNDQKRTIRHLASGFFLSGGILYKRTPDLGLLRCVDAKEFSTIMVEIHSRVYGDMIRSPPAELHTMYALWPFVAWRMEVIGPILHKVGRSSNFQFKIAHRNSTPYRPKANGTVEAANKNIKKILRKIVQGFRQWHEKLPFALLEYRTTVRTSTGATPYLLVYGIEAVVPAEVEILSLRVIVEAEIDDDEWVKTRLEQLSLIE